MPPLQAGEPREYPVPSGTRWAAGQEFAPTLDRRHRRGPTPLGPSCPTPPVSRTEFYLYCVPCLTGRNPWPYNSSRSIPAGRHVMERRFQTRLDDLRRDALVPPGLLRGLAPRLDTFLRPFVA